MRIAICFSGQPRFVKECYPTIEKFFLEPNINHQIDIFAHTWFSDEICDKPLYSNGFSSFSGGAKIAKDSIESIKKFYKPLSILVDEPRFFVTQKEIWENYVKFSITEDSDFGMPMDEFLIKRSDAVYSMMYSLMQSIILKKSVELNDGFKYDYVVKLRFDNIFTSPVVLDNLNSKLLYSQEMGKKNYEISDWVNFSNSENMDVLGSIYMNIDHIIQHSISNYGGWSAESLFKSVCEINQIQTQTLFLGTKLPVWGKI